MGRTLATFTQHIAREIASWRAFRRALRREDQDCLDALFRAAKYHVAAGSYASKASPFEAMVVSMLIESHKSNLLLEKRLARLEQARHENQIEKESGRESGQVSDQGSVQRRDKRWHEPSGQEAETDDDENPQGPKKDKRKPPYN